MRQVRPIVLAITLLISACGTAPPQAAPQPTSAPEASAPTAASPPTEAAFVSPSGAPAPSPSPSAAAASAPAATAAPEATAGPTERLILPAATALAPTAEAPPAAATPTAAPAGLAAPKATAAPKPARARQPSEPVRMVIGAIKLDGRLVSVGLDKNRIPIVPNHDIGWYNLSARPGEGENIVLWGHVLRFREAPKVPAPFAHIKELKLGAAVKLYDRKGNVHNYVITKQIWVTPDQVEYILPRGREMVTMVSCIGDKIIQDGEVVDESHRLITIAEPEA